MQILALLVEMVELITSVLVMLVIIQFIISLLFTFNVVSPGNEFLRQVFDAIDRLLSPILRPIRNVMPNTGAIDFSPLALIVGLQLLILVLTYLRDTY